MVIALPLGAAIGHTGKAHRIGVRSGQRAARTAHPRPADPAGAVGSAYLKGNVALLGPAIAVLVILAVPPILSNTYAGIAAVDPAARDAAQGMGMTGREVLTKVECRSPCR